MMDFLGQLGSILWGPWTFIALMLAGVVFTIWTKFTQYRSLTHGIAVIRGVYDDPNDPGAINHFQALSAALSATVGLGNIGGVALAIAAGGPGSLFWMWIIGALGMALKTVEITLSQMYRNIDDPDNPHGGAMWVVDKVVASKGGGWKVFGKSFAVFFCITLLISSITGGNMFQAWSVANLTQGYFDVPRVATGIILAVVIGLVIIGGIKRIGKVAGKLVPLMCVLYLLAAFAVLSVHVADIPSMIMMVVRDAFSPTQAAGSFIGGSIAWAFSTGLRRALFSNEAGQGSAPIAHAAAKTDEPAREGIVGGIGPFIDTICICTLTALVIIATGTWNREAMADYGSPIHVERVGDPDSLTWRIVADDSLENLPTPADGPWQAGDRIYLVAEVQGAVNKKTHSNRLRWESSIEPAENITNPDVAVPLHVAWKDIKLAPADFEGTPTDLKLVSPGIWRRYEGAQLTAHAFDRQFPGLGKWLVTVAAWLFAVSTMISWSYYGEQGMVYMLGLRSVLPYKFVYLICVVIGAEWIRSTDQMEVIMDIGTGAMLWSNIPIVLTLGYLAVRCLADYDRRLKAGEFPRHQAPSLTEVAEGKDVEK